MKQCIDFQSFKAPLKAIQSNPFPYICPTELSQVVIKFIQTNINEMSTTVKMLCFQEQEKDQSPTQQMFLEGLLCASHHTRPYRYYNE